MSQLTLEFARSDIPGYPGYSIDKNGTVYGLKGQPLIGDVTDGYRRVWLGKTRHFVHRLVLLTFVGTCPIGFQARHKNDDRSDNRLSNLCWGTPKQNAQDRKKSGYARKGLSPEQKQRARYLYEHERWSFEKLHKEFRCDHHTVRRYARRYNWQRVASDGIYNHPQRRQG